MTRDQKIGYIGAVGAGGVFHLHFEIRSSFHPDADNADYWKTSFLGNRRNVFAAYESPLAFVRSYENPYQPVIIVEDAVTYPNISNDISNNKVFADGKVIKERFFEPYKLLEWPVKWYGEAEGTGENRGFEGNYHYASTAAGSETSSGKWYFHIPQSGKYKIYVSIPHGYATTEKANYEISHNNQTDHVVINQNSVDGSLEERWASLGVFDFKSGNNHYVRLGNNTGETGKYVAFDAIKLVPVSVSGEPEVPCPSGNGAYCGSIDSSLNDNTLYYCQDGNYQALERCSYGCEVMPSGANDRCSYGADPSLRAVYRFWSEQNKAHFYTISEEERNAVIADYTDSQWRYEGVAWYAYTTQKNDSLPVYRFWSEQNKHHFYTISEDEKKYVDDHYTDYEWKYEGIEWYAYP